MSKDSDLISHYDHFEIRQHFCRDSPFKISLVNSKKFFMAQKYVEEEGYVRFAPVVRVFNKTAIVLVLRRFYPNLLVYMAHHDK